MSKPFAQTNFIDVLDETTKRGSVSIRSTSDNGWVLFSSDSLTFHKFSACGDYEWGKKYEVEGFDYNYSYIFNSFIEISDGGYIFLSRIDINSNTTGFSATRLDSFGNVIWSKKYRYNDTGIAFFPYVISETPQGNFILSFNAHLPEGHSVLLLVDKNGSPINSLAHVSYSWFSHVGTSDGGCLMNHLGILTKLDANFNIEWSKRYLLNSSYLFHPTEVEDGYVFSTSSSATGNEIMLAKYTKNGDIALGGYVRTGYYGVPGDLQLTPNGNIVTTFSKNISGKIYPVIVEFDKDLNIVKESAIGSINSFSNMTIKYVNHSFEDKPIITGTIIADDFSEPVIFHGKLDEDYKIECDTLLLSNFSAPQTYSLSAPSVNYTKLTFQHENYPITVSSINVTSTRICEEFIEKKLYLGNDTLMCSNTSFEISNQLPDVFDFYDWSTGETTESIEISEEGEYILNAYYDCGKRVAFDTLKVSLISFESVYLPADTTICSLQPIILSAETPDATYKWNTGSIESKISVTQSGKYSVDITKDNCTITYEVEVNDCEKLLFPNVFTPNNDGKNDVFKPTQIEGIIDIDLKIYNRWGQIVFASDDINNLEWKGEDVTEGTYFLIVNYINYRGEKKKATSTLSIFK
ncbi:MAG: gliding motility-associated C-terminal domain-containing protein [Bacteroidia bacterium]